LDLGAEVPAAELKKKIANPSLLKQVSKAGDFIGADISDQKNGSPYIQTEPISTMIYQC
jgi:hypothetical protein